MIKFNYKVEGMRDLQRSLDKLGKTPQKYVTASSKKGMNIVKKQAKADAPIWSGYLEKSIILTGEKSRIKAKKIFRVVFDRAYNDVFQKTSKEGEKSYYPVSQEFGYWTRQGKKPGSKPSRYIPGLMFVRKALEGKAKEVERTIVGTMKKKVDAEIAKEGLK